MEIKPALYRSLPILLVTFVLSLCSGAISAAKSAEKSAENASTQVPWLQQAMSLPDARHLLGRTGFGASAEELVELLSLSRAEAVQSIVDGLETKPALSMPAWVSEPAPHFWTRRALPVEGRQAFDRERDAEISELRRWWVNNMLTTRSPQTERLVLFWHDHFATSYHGVDRRSISMARQNQLFRQLGTSSYRELLKNIIRDPAMLRYLDNQTNRKGKPNENLARELMELFTLGEGNFGEATVKEAARALTGFNISITRNESFQFFDYQHDSDEKTLFGHTGHFDGDDLVNLILEQPEAAEHLVKRFWHAFISDLTPDEKFVERLSTSFRSSDYNLKVLYSSMLRSEAFWHDKNRLSLIKSPAALLIGTARSLDYPKRSWTQFPALHALLGMDLFAPPNVAGWSEGAAFVAPGTLLNRQLALQTITSVPITDGLNTSMAGQNNIDNSMMMSPQRAMQKLPLQVRVAGHLFNGAPQYKVNLLDEKKRLVWSSDVRSVKLGYDTQMFGEMRNMDQLAWHNEGYEPSEKALERSHWAQVEFLNDAASKLGDRNLFVDSVSVRSNRYTSAGGKQKSNCAPKNKRDAGNLYCAGSVTIDITGKAKNTLARSEPYTAANVSVIWANRNEEKLKAGISLEHVQTPDQYFHTVSFQVTSNNRNELSVALDTSSCWPDCIKQWPDCALVNSRTNYSRLNFIVQGDPSSDNKSASHCHYEKISQSEQALIDAIVASLPRFVDFISDAAAEGFKDRLKRWQKRLANIDSVIEASEYAKADRRFVIDNNFEKPSSIERGLPAPQVAIENLQAVEQLLLTADLSLAQLLIGGSPVEQFPKLDVIATQSIEQQLETVLTHPAYQVH